MGQYLLKLPKMGESVAEATVTKWLKEIGETIAIDEPIVEIATDKVDTDVTSEVEGILLEKRCLENETIKVGEVLLVIETLGEDNSDVEQKGLQKQSFSEIFQVELPKTSLFHEEDIPGIVEKELTKPLAKSETIVSSQVFSNASRFYSPLVRNIAKEEGITQLELDQILGTGKDQRVTKNDVLNYIKSKGVTPEKTHPNPSPNTISKPILTSATESFRELTRMEKLISEHMSSSIKTAAHVQSFIEADVTDLWNWRSKVKDSFESRVNEKLTFTPLFMTAVIKALRDFPELNSSLQEDKIIIKQQINLGMATALPDGNLIVPVIKNADHLNLIGLAKAVNDLSNRARKNQLQPDEIQGGTYTITNIGNFGSIMGTPIINQPQVGILAIGAIRKMPAVIETEEGDFIGIRRKVILTHSYDHRIINGATGGLFVQKVTEYLENWDEHLPF
jgi:2-oxoglutarate dehydrogenase E2 component (dihydrolipoamide succinyltransferase)